MFLKFSEKYLIHTILSAAVLVRVFEITKKDFWYDEAFTGIVVKEGFRKMLEIVVNDVHPPLYYILVKLFTFPFGYDVFSIRLFSLVFGILGVLAVYLLAKDIFNNRAALFASLITAISPFAVQYSQEGRMYSMFSFLVVFATYWLIKALKKDTLKEYMLWGVFWGLACLTHYLGILFGPIFYGLFLLGRMNKKNDESGWHLFLPSKGLALGGVISAGLFSFWIGKFIEHSNRTNTLNWISPARLSDIFLNLQMFLFGIPRSDYSGMPEPNSIYGFDPLTIFLLVTIFTTGVLFSVLQQEKKKEAWQVILLGFGFIGTLYALSLMGRHYLVVRYIMPSAYFLFILLGFWLSSLHWKYCFFTLTIYFVLLGGVHSSSIYGGFGQILKDSEKFEGKNFYALNSFDYVIAKYYFGPEKVILYNIDWPEYDSSTWAAIGKEHLKKTEQFDVLRNDPNGLILYNTQVSWEARSDKSFDQSKFELIDQYDNILIYRSNPKFFFR